MDVPIEPIEALTALLDLPGIWKIRLDFLVTYESGAFYIRCLNLSIMSCGETLDECKENIQEAILIYLEDLPEGQSLFKPTLPKYWKIFYKLRRQKEQKSPREKYILEQFLVDYGESFLFIMFYEWR